jgi:hypothetical protein
VAEFHFIHLDTVQETPGVEKPAGARIDDRMYKACGKPRPMLVLGASSGNYYKVLKLTGEGRHLNGELKRGFIELGYLLSDKKISYTDGAIYDYPFPISVVGIAVLGSRLPVFKGGVGASC